MSQTSVVSVEDEEIYADFAFLSKFVKGSLGGIQIIDTNLHTYMAAFQLLFF